MSKLTDLAALGGTPADDDLLHVVDVSDTTMAPSGTNKTITWGGVKSGLTLLPGPYADDAAAGAAGVPVNSAYRKTGGTVAWRVS